MGIYILFDWLWNITATSNSNTKALKLSGLIYAVFRNKSG